MNISISWGDFRIVCVIVTGIYYIIIGLRYYQKDIKRFIKPTANSEYSHKYSTRQKETNTPQQKSLFPEIQSIHKGDAVREHRDLQPLVHELVNEADSLLEQLAAQEVDKITLVDALRNLLSKYSQLYGSQYQEDILNLLRLEAENHCNVRLTAEDVAILW